MSDTCSKLFSYWSSFHKVNLVKRASTLLAHRAMASTVWVLSFVALSMVLHSAMAGDVSRRNEKGDMPVGIATHSPPPPGSLPPPPPPPASKSNAAPFRPSMAVIVGVLTTLFSITFLLLLYAKHCSGRGATRSPAGHSGMGTAAARRNSGIDRVVVESLPLFRFGSLMGHKEGLECAVCLARFEAAELLRLLPKCKHAFHVECVDTWLDAHSTCPLCRYRVDPEDVLLVDERKPTGDLLKDPARAEHEAVIPAFRRISGRHSSAGEKSTGLLQAAMNAAFNRRRSVDEAASLGCFDRGRKDTILTTERERFEHRIVISDADTPPAATAEVRPALSELLFIRPEEVIRQARSRASCSALHRKGSRREAAGEVRLVVTEDPDGGGRSVMSTRCVSEITGLSRFRRLDEAEHVAGGEAAATAAAGEDSDRASRNS